MRVKPYQTQRYVAFFITSGSILIQCSTSICMIVGCILSLIFLFHSKNINYYGDVTRSRLSKKAFAFRSCWSSSEGSLACHAYCDMWYPFPLMSKTNFLNQCAGVIAACVSRGNYCSIYSEVTEYELNTIDKFWMFIFIKLFYLLYS